MKRALSILLIVGALTGMLCACAKQEPVATPAMQLDLVQMVDTAKAEGGGNAGNGSLKAQLNAPDTYRFDTTNEKGNLRVTVDAAVCLPETDALPVARMRQISFTEDDVRHFANVLFGEGARYIDPSGSGTLVRTKAYLARELWYYQHGIDTGTYDDMKYDSVEDLYPIVEEFKKEIETAPEEFAEIEPDFSLRSSSGEVDLFDGSVYLRTAPDNATISWLDVMNHESLSQMAYMRDHLQYFGLSNMTHAGAYRTMVPADVSKLLTISEQEAQTLAERTVRELGFDGLVCSGKRQVVYDGVYDADRHGVYEFMFTPVVGGVPVTFTNADQASHASSGAFGDHFYWDYEQLRVIVDDGGVLWLQYTHPCSVTEVMTEQAALLPFSEIQRVFEKLILVSGGDHGSGILEHDRTGSLKISELRLGLMTLPDQTSPGTALVVPVWDFFGVCTLEDPERGDTLIGRDGYASLFTINAIDGTVISRESGR